MICPTCGEPIDDDLDRCPYCETNVSAKPKRVGIAVINLKDGQPTVSVARDRLDAAITNHLLKSTEGLVLIHGYGSSGEGGLIREMVRERLQHLKYDGTIKDFVHGEEIGFVYSGRLPESFQPTRADTGNAGITVVKL
jgi:hypothetical protein